MTREMIKLKEDKDLTGWELLHKFILVGRLIFVVASQLTFQYSLSRILEFEESIYWSSPKGLGWPLKTPERFWKRDTTPIAHSPT